MNCRHCQSPLTLPLIDFGSAPPSNALLTADSLAQPERYFPLRVLVCQSCWLAQTEDFGDSREIFSADYPYFSGCTAGWLKHCEQYVEQMTSRFALSSHSHVVEIAANDGSLLQYVQAREIPCLGIEPAAGPAAVALAKGIPIMEGFFGADMARWLATENKQADLVVANNVLAHVPDINDFVRGVAILLKPDGVATFEFPHLLRLIDENQFDTIYHEHFSYLSLTAVANIFGANGLDIFDVEEIPTHGGSLRVFAQREDTGSCACRAEVADILEIESRVGLASASFYSFFQSRADQTKNAFLAFLLAAKQQGKQVVGYGAAAKGATLLNYAGVRPDLFPFVADISPAKQGKFLPGSRIPIVSEERIIEDKPDYVVVLPWNWKTEIMKRLEYVRSWGGKFVVAVPRLEVL